mgnify:CR=1 FL=1
MPNPGRLRRNPMVMPRNNQGGNAALARIHEVLDGIRTRLRLDEADLAVVDMSEEGVLLLRFFGRHATCPVALATLQAGIDDALRERVPQLRRVVVMS